VTSIRSASTSPMRHPSARHQYGQDVRTLKDATGKGFGEDIYKAVQEGKINEVSYNFPNRSDRPSPR